MDDSELEDFIKVLQENGFDHSDFLVNEQDLTDWRPNQIVPIQSAVTVQRKFNGIQATYNSGTGTNWVIDFEQQLLAGHFN